MRITNNILSQNLMRNLETAEEKVDKLQNQLSSGHKINCPSDDPAGVQNIMRLKSNISSVEQWKNNADAALDYMNTTESTMGEMTSMLQRVRELAVEGADGTLSTDDRTAIADEVGQISDQLRVMANTQVGSKYIFSGTATDKELQIQDPSTGKWTTQISKGNDQNVEFQVGNNVNISISVKGKDLFGDDSAGLFVDLDNLKNALEKNDTSTVNTSIGTIDSDVNNVISLRADLGARINRVTSIQSQLDSTSTNLKANLSSIQDADMAQTITDFTNQQNVYKAALAVGAKIIQPSLVDFMS